MGIVVIGYTGEVLKFLVDEVTRISLSTPLGLDLNPFFIGLTTCRIAAAMF
jgi:hypothetical protein